MKKANISKINAAKKLRAASARRSVFLSLSLLLTVILSLTACYIFVLRPERDYRNAATLIEQCDWSKAELAFRALGRYEDSEEKADYSGCMKLFECGDLDDASVLYEQLSENSKTLVNSRLGSFKALAQKAIDEERFEDAYKYYSLDKDDPESGGIMYSLDLYIQADALIQQNEYGQARDLLAGQPIELNDMSAHLQQLLDDSYEAEYNEYELLSYSDLNKAAEGMESIKDEYEKAGSFITDLNACYSEAQSLFSQKKYAEAQKYYNEIITYKDSSRRAIACDVMIAHELAVDGNVEAAKEILSTIDTSEDFVPDVPEDSPLLDYIGRGTRL